MLGRIPLYLCPSPGCEAKTITTVLARDWRGLVFRCDRGHSWYGLYSRMWSALDYRPGPAPTPWGKLEVCRGPREGEWTVRGYARHRIFAERVLARWRREFQGQIVRPLQDGVPIEDDLRAGERKHREAREREVAYFERLAGEADRESKTEDAARYRSIGGISRGIMIAAQSYLLRRPWLSC